MSTELIVHIHALTIGVVLFSLAILIDDRGARGAAIASATAGVASLAAGFAGLAAVLI